MKRLLFLSPSRRFFGLTASLLFLLALTSSRSLATVVPFNQLKQLTPSLDTTLGTIEDVIKTEEASPLITSATSSSTFDSTLPILASDYCVFLNAVGKSDPHNLYELAKENNPKITTIIREGTPGSYGYYCVNSNEKSPISYIDAESAMRYCNWMENGQQADPDSTESGAYELSSNLITVNSNSAYYLTREEENSITSIKSNKVGFNILIINNSPLLTLVRSDKELIEENSPSIKDAFSVLAILAQLATDLEVNPLLLSEEFYIFPSKISKETLHHLPNKSSEIEPTSDKASLTQKTAHDFYYSSELTTSYTANREKYQETDTTLFDKLKKINPTDQIVLDLGCGQGDHARAIADMGASHVFASDISEEMIRRAKAKNSHEKITFSVANGTALPVADNSINIVFSNFVFHYFEDTNSLFHEIARVLTLTPGGRVIATFNITSVRTGFEGLYNTFMPIRLGGPESTVVVQNLIKSRKEIEDSLEKNNLEILEECELDHPNAVVDKSFAFFNVVEKHAMLFVLEKKHLFP